MTYPINDPYFRVEVLSKTERPSLLCYLAMHQCYAEKPIDQTRIDTLAQLDEAELGRRLVEKCIKFGHWSVIEHATISFLVSGFPHSVLGQITRHRHLSFSVQSQRYTGERISKLSEMLLKSNFSSKDIDDAEYDAHIATIEEEIKKHFYFRPLDTYTDRNGAKYDYGKDELENDIYYVWGNLEHHFYISKKVGYAHEHSRDFLPQNIRQDFVVTMNARSLLHFCDLRLPADAQPEIRTLAQMIFEQFECWMPEVAEWYKKNRYAKNKLSP